MVNDYMLCKVLDKIKETIGIVKGIEIKNGKGKGKKTKYTVIDIVRQGLSLKLSSEPIE